MLMCLPPFPSKRFYLSIVTLPVQTGRIQHGKLFKKSGGTIHFWFYMKSAWRRERKSTFQVILPRREIMASSSINFTELIQILKSDSTKGPQCWVSLVFDLVNLHTSFFYTTPYLISAKLKVNIVFNLALESCKWNNVGPDRR